MIVTKKYLESLRTGDKEKLIDALIDEIEKQDQAIKVLLDGLLYYQNANSDQRVADGDRARKRVARAMEILCEEKL